jgi:hypothetical protein
MDITGGAEKPRGSWAKERPGVGRWSSAARIRTATTSTAARPKEGQQGPSCRRRHAGRRGLGGKHAVQPRIPGGIAESDEVDALSVNGSADLRGGEGERAHRRAFLSEDRDRLADCISRAAGRRAWPAYGDDRRTSRRREQWRARGEAAARARRATKSVATGRLSEGAAEIALSDAGLADDDVLLVGRMRALG